jgi:tetratricopeptide (TPR) repeat protein
VALKVFAAEGRDAEKLDRFVREARLLSDVDSPHVVRYVAHGVEPDGSAFLAVEWLEGEDLAKRSKRETLDGNQVVKVIAQAARGLEALHARGIVHRDVKPSNLFLTKDASGEMLVKLLDLGVARTLADPGLTRHGTMIGTPSYMSPEQVLGGVDLSFRSDIFSLGVVLFELVAGVRPYVAEDIFAVVAKIALQDPPRLAAVAPGVSAELDAVVARAMAKRPEDRFASASELAEALARVPPFTPRSRLFAPKEEETHTAAVRSIATTERRIVTVLFARFETPEDASGAKEAFEAAVKELGGVAYTLLARAHVGIFGGERSAGDEAARAARAALALRDRLKGASITVSTGRAEAGGAEPTGEAIDRGARGADQRSTALRVDQVTARLLGDAFELEGSAPWLTLRGERVAPMRVRTLLGRPTPCVGREREIAHLESLYAEVEAESVTRAALVLAPPGGGKSRIRHELLSRLAARPKKPIVLLGRGSSAFGGGSPFGLIGSAIRAHARIQADEPIANQRQKLGATIREGTTSTFMPLLAQIAAVDDPQPRAVGDGMFVSDLVRDAFERWVEQVTQTAPLVVVFEDVHAGDVASVALVEAILRNLPDLPVLALAFGRPEAEQRFAGRWAGSAPVTIRLPKLSKRAQAELATAVLGKSATPEVVDKIVSLADGNAFYLEELVRRVSDGAPGDEEGLPETVLAMLQARLDALGDDAKRALKAASVFGDGFWPGAIANVLGDEIDHSGSLGRMMHSLVDAEILERRQASRFAGEDELVFRSTLLREAAYGLLADADREVAHRRAASWLALHGEQDHLALARHFELGGQRDKASSQFAHAAEQALFGNDYAGAVDSAARALSCGASGEVRGRIQVMVAEAERWRGGIPAALEAAREACKLLPAGTLAWFHAMRERVAAEGRLANKDAIVSLAEELLSASSEPEARSAQIAALVPAAVHLLYVGHKARAQGLALGVEGLAARAGPSLEPRARARLSQLRAALAAAEDDLGRAIDEQERALALFEGAGDHRAAALVCSNLAFQWYAVGGYERAEALLRRALATAKRLGLATIGPLAKQNLGAALYAKGELDEAIAVQTEAADTFAEQHDPRLEGYSRVHLAFAYAARGDLEEAERHAQIAVRGGVEPVAVGARAALARIALVRGDVPGALEHARIAKEILERLGTVEEFDVLARITVADALEASGDAAGAKKAITRAKEIIQARASKLKNPEVLRSFRERVPENREALSRMR